MYPKQDDANMWFDNATNLIISFGLNFVFMPTLNN